MCLSTPSTNRGCSTKTMNATTNPRTRKLGFDSPATDVRLDKYLTQVLPQFSRAHLQRLIEQGYVLVNGQRTKARQRLTRSDRIAVELPPSPDRPMPEPIPLTAIYEDQDVTVIDKPAGLTVHPAPGHPSHTLVNAILAHCPGLTTSNDVMRPGIVHRLDKDTSGLIVIAKTNSAQECLAAQFKTRQVTPLQPDKLGDWMYVACHLRSALDKKSQQQPGAR